MTRSRVSRPASLDGKEAKAERSEVAKHYRRKANWKEAFPFRVYQHQDVRDALERLFRQKCAYCESLIGATDDSEIEHWRPKGAVKEDDGKRSHPAYHWLASDWDNLLLSCLKCNRPRTYRLRGAPEEAEDVWERSGKGMLFPLAEGDVRAKRKGQEASEHPLLLNPCTDNPEYYLDFIVFSDDDRARGTLKPKGKRGRRRERGDRSIEVYGLNRKLLTDRRRSELTLFQESIAAFKDAMEEFDRTSSEYSARQMAREAKLIAGHLTPDSQYLLMTKQALADFLRRHPAVRRRLEQAMHGARS